MIYKKKKKENWEINRFPCMVKGIVMKFQVVECGFYRQNRRIKITQKIYYRDNWGQNILNIYGSPNFIWIFYYCSSRRRLVEEKMHSNRLKWVKVVFVLFVTIWSILHYHLFKGLLFQWQKTRQNIVFSIRICSLFEVQKPSISHTQLFTLFLCFKLMRHNSWLQTFPVFAFGSSFAMNTYISYRIACI